MSFAKLTAMPGLTTNYSLYAVPAGWVVSMAPLWWAIGAAKSSKLDAYNNAEPGDSWKNIKESGLDAQLPITMDSSGNLPLFAAGLVAANAARVPISEINLWSGIFLASRVGYNLAYVLIETETKSWFRSTLYWCGVVSTFVLFTKAGQRWAVLPA